MQNNIPPSRGIFITASYFSPRARYVGIKCIDGKEFAEMEATLRHRWRRRVAIGVAIAAVGASMFAVSWADLVKPPM